MKLKLSKFSRWSCAMILSLSILIASATPMRSHAATSTVSGWLDSVTSTYIAGWAWNSSIPNTPIDVHVYVYNSSGTVVLAQAVYANNYRADLASGGIGNGNHGYNYVINWSQFPTGQYSVVVFGIDNVVNPPLLGVPKYYTHTNGQTSGITNGAIYYLKNKHSGLYLDVQGGVNANATNVWQYPFNATIAQQWKAIYQNDGTYKLQAMNTTDKYLEVAYNSNLDGTNIDIYNGNYTEQYWSILSNGNGSFKLLSKCSNYTKGAVVEGASISAGANVYQYTYIYGGEDNDDWVIEPAEIFNQQFSQSGRETPILWMVEHGPTLFAIDWSYFETYDRYGGKTYLKHRQASIIVKTSRQSYDIPYHFYANGIWHKNSLGSTIKTFNMTNYWVILSGDTWQWYCKENNETVWYYDYQQYHAEFTVDIIGDPGVEYDYANTFKINLF